MEILPNSETDINLPNRLTQTTLEDLELYMDISTRAYNVCKKNNILALSDLLAFFIREGGFLKLRNAGRKTTEELEVICQRLLSQATNNPIETLPLEAKNQQLSWIKEIAPSNLSEAQIQLLNAYILQWHGALTIRTQNALNNFLKDKIDYFAFHYFFFEKQIQKDKIKNVGNKSFQEIEEFVDRVRRIAKEIRLQSDEPLKADLFATQFCEAFSLSREIIIPYLSAIRAKKFPLFHFLQELMVNHHLFDKKRTLIFRSRSGWFQSVEIVELDAIGEKIGLTGERIRQIAKKAEENFLETIAFFNAQKLMLLHFTGGCYGLDTSRDLLIVRKQLSDNINHIERTDFSPKFFALVFAALHSDTHMLFGRQFDFFQNNYLIRHDLLLGFDAENFINDIGKLTSERIKEDFSLDLEGYVLRFFKPGISRTILGRVRNISLDLLMLEFSEKVRLELPNELIICRNTKQQVWEYAFEALETIGKPAKLDYICQIILEKYPDFETSLEGMRGTLIKERTHFISFSRTSTYGLAKWENERKDIRGGTIRDIAEEYLHKFSEPKHCFDITQFVLKYRPDTTMKSVQTNLHYDESGRFQEFSAGFWGLSDQIYHNFNASPMSNHTFTYFKLWLSLNPGGSPEEAIKHLSERCNVQPVQIRSWLTEKVRSGTLRLEQNKILIIQ
jgi:hypothetical protein